VVPGAQPPEPPTVQLVPQALPLQLKSLPHAAGVPATQLPLPSQVLAGV
jgi:hypothetical protein